MRPQRLFGLQDEATVDHRNPVADAFDERIDLLDPRHRREPFEEPVDVVGRRHLHRRLTYSTSRSLI